MINVALVQDWKLFSVDHYVLCISITGRNRYFIKIILYFTDIIEKVYIFQTKSLTIGKCPSN